MVQNEYNKSIKPEKFQATVLNKKSSDLINTSLQVDDQVIKSVSSLELLGIQIDGKLNFNLRISIICKSASNQLNTLIRLKRLVNALSILDYCCWELRPRGWKGLDPALKRNVETIYLFKFIIKFVYESYLLLNLRQMSYEFSLKYFKSYFVTMLIKLRFNKQNLSGSV